MIESDITELTNISVEKGAAQVKRVAPREIVVSQWVRNKCLYGCVGYGKRFTCPPYTPTIDETKAVLQSYTHGLLIEFTDLSQDVLGNFRSVTETVCSLEKAAFVKGYEKALSFGAGACTLCSECPAENLAEPSLFSKKDCLHPQQTRPSMEAVGIDVFSTVRNYGFELETVKDYADPYKLFGLLLIE